MRDVTFEDLTTGDYVQYKINEGAGTTVVAYDRNGNQIPGEDGTITPDANWDQI
jgi:hypothetical protein